MRYLSGPKKSLNQLPLPTPGPDTRIADLIMKHLKGELTTDEEVELSGWLSESESNRILFNEICKGQLFDIFDELDKIKLKEEFKFLQKTFENTTTRKRKLRIKRKSIYKIAILSSSIIFFIIINFRNNKNRISEDDEFVGVQFSVNSLPIQLTLSNGKIIDLESHYETIKENNAILRRKGNTISYTPIDSQSRQEYNCISTSNGKQFQIVLPDGSKVWLNAESSIVFPTTFSGKKRKVKIIGEAYFEIVKIVDSSLPNYKVPFKVELNNNKQIDVIGTHFNVTAYNDDIRTTLLEGKIEVKNGKYSKILSPNEQAIITSSGKIKIDHVIDANETISWKEGLFNFNNAPIEMVMAEISRWYNVSIEYEHYVSSHMTITVPRAITLKNLLYLLELNSSVHFEISGNKVFVSI